MKLILCAGMPRAGSTLLFQLVREVIWLVDPDPHCILTGPRGPRGERLVKQIEKAKEHKRVVVKLHLFSTGLLKFWPMIFTSYRDPRGIVASYKRLGWTVDRSLIDQALPRRIRHLRCWTEASHCYAFRYERFTKDLPYAIRVIANRLKVFPTEDEIATITDRCLLKNHDQWENAGMNRSTGSDWEVDLTEEEQNKVIAVAKNYMLHYGYLKEGQDG